jgi:hypothetical protein
MSARAIPALQRTKVLHYVLNDHIGAPDCRLWLGLRLGLDRRRQCPGRGYHFFALPLTAIRVLRIFDEFDVDPEGSALVGFEAAGY